MRQLDGFDGGIVYSVLSRAGRRRPGEGNDRKSMMADTLRLTLQTDTDGTGELFVEAASGGFRGAARAWFDVQALADFALRLDAYPLPREGPPVLEGGFWNEGRIDQRHVGLEFRQIDQRGTIGIQIELATPIHQGDRADSGAHARFEILTDYAQLQRFAGALRRLATGAADEACLGAGGNAADNYQCG